MGDWDFLFDLKGQELEDAMATGMSYSDWSYIDSVEEEQEDGYETNINRKINTVVLWIIVKQVDTFN